MNGPFRPFKSYNETKNTRQRNVSSQTVLVFLFHRKKRGNSIGEIIFPEFWIPHLLKNPWPWSGPAKEKVFLQNPYKREGKEEREVLQ